jgi:hypothetical protein
MNVELARHRCRRNVSAHIPLFSFVLECRALVPGIYRESVDAWALLAIGTF